MQMAEIYDYRIVGFLWGALIPWTVHFQFIRDFMFTNGSAKNSAMQWVVHFFRGVKFHEWATSMKFVEFTYLEKN